ncbi:MAG: hypothetical protein Q7K34_02390 [archaeon]|nr:hypothetical protein [archaeon]
MQITGHEIQPLYYAVVEAHNDYHKAEGKLNGLIDSYNKLEEMGYKFKDKDYFEGLSKIERLPRYDPKKEELGDYYDKVTEKFAKIELNLEILYGRFFSGSIKRPSSKENISIQQEQKVSQKQEVHLQTITSFNQAIEVITNLDLRTKAKEEAINNINELQNELKKQKPSSTIIRRIISWASDFSTITGVSLLPFIIKLLLDNWEKIFTHSAEA